MERALSRSHRWSSLLAMTDWLGLTGRAALVAGAGGVGGGGGARPARERAPLGRARAGARGVVTDVDEPRLDALARAAAGTHAAEVKTVAADLTSAPSARQAVHDAAAMLGGLDVFVHAVGVNDRRAGLDTPEE